MFFFSAGKVNVAWTELSSSVAAAKITQKNMNYWPDLFCFLLGLLTAEGNSVWLGRPLPVPFLSLQLSESLPLPTPSLLLERDRDSGEPWEKEGRGLKQTFTQVKVSSVCTSGQILSHQTWRDSTSQTCLTSYVVVILGLYETWLALRSSLMVSAGMDLEKPRPLQVLVGVRTSVTTGFFSIAVWIQTHRKSWTHHACIWYIYTLNQRSPTTGAGTSTGQWYWGIVWN